MARSRLLRRRALGALLALALTVPALAAAPWRAVPASAASGADFKAGEIISDSVFYDYGAMTVSQIQRFLDAHVPACQSVTPACLDTYRMDTGPRGGEEGLCGAYPGKTNQSAAMILFDVAQACRISPKVLLVLLQKEQALVTSARPSEYAYRYATGWCVTDSGSCVGANTGLFNQLYMGARQFQQYRKYSGSYRYQAGRTNTIQWHPNQACGTSNVFIQNQATAALYIYTPYRPNAAALSNMYGVGDSCSAYGNRNFWRLYTDWFGSTIGGSFLLTSEGATENALITDSGLRHPYSRADTALARDFAPLGPVGTVSAQYLQDMPAGEGLGRYVAGKAGGYYLVDDGKLHVLPFCNMVVEHGADCATIPRLSPSQIAAFTPGTQMSNVVNTTNGKQFRVIGGQKRQILDAASRTGSGLSYGSGVTLTQHAIHHLPYGPPIARDTVLVRAGGSQVYLWFGGTFYRVGTALGTELPLETWFGAAGALDFQSIAAAGPAVPIDGLIRVAGTEEHYVVGPAGRTRITDPVPWGPHRFVEVPATLAQNIPAAPTAAAAGRYLDADGVRYRVSGGKKHRLVGADAYETLAAYDPDASVLAVPAPVAATLPTGSDQIAPGTLVRTRYGRETHLVTGLDARLTLSTASLGPEWSPAGPIVVTSGTLAAYGGSGKVVLGATCGSGAFLASGGDLHPLTASAASEYGFGFPVLDAVTCEALELSPVAAGRWLRDAETKKVFFVDDGRKRPALWSTYAKLRGSEPAHLYVSWRVLAALPTGSVLGP